MSRNDLTLSNKIGLLDKIKSQPIKTSYRRLAEITGVPKTTISRLLKQENQLREEWALQKGRTATCKRKRDGKNPDVEKALDQWFSVVSGQGVNISGSMLLTKSEEFAKKLGYDDFKATNGWLSRWKARHNIKFKKAHGEKDSADSISGEQWKNSKMPTFLEDFSINDIYNADKTCLYYHALPKGSLCYNHIALSRYKRAMDRITVLCCVNISGTDKRKLLIVGKSAQCFEGLKKNCLPVDYHANKNALITSEIFQSYLTSWDIELQLKERKILLLLDNCAAHPPTDNLKNIKLEFIPPTTTSLAQPMNMALIKNLKVLYQQQLVNYILESIDEKSLTSSSTDRETGAKISLLQAIQFLADSWQAIKTTTIQNCFAAYGLKSLGNPDIDENEDMLHTATDIDNKEFYTVDNNLSCFDENEGCVDAVFKLKEEKFSEESDDDAPVPVTNREAKKCIDTLRRYFMQEGNEGCSMSALNTYADFIELQTYKNKRETTLDEVS